MSELKLGSGDSIPHWTDEKKREFKQILDHYKAITETCAVVRVCPEYDRECGSNSFYWCETCPKRFLS
jgi:hypothetical protein